MYKLLITISILMLLTGCADNVTLIEATKITPVGFWYGVWHGMTSTIALIGHLFNDDIAVYALYNNGAWYNFGFLIGIGGLYSGGKKRVK